MTTQSPRFVGLAVAFVAGTLLSSTVAPGQGPGRRTNSGSPNAGPFFDAAMRSGISGVVRDHAGRPQIGAVVELLNAQSALLARTFTDDRGRYSLPRLSAGLYQIQASSSLFLPAIRPDLRLLANSKAVVNLTLNTVSEALNWLPAQPRDAHSTNDDWDWTLRLATNRPLLRFRDPARNDGKQADESSRGPLLAEPVVLMEKAEEDQGRESTRLQIRQGLSQFGEGGLQQQLAWRAPLEGDQAVLFRAETATPDRDTGRGLGRFSAAAAYRRELSPDRSWTAVATITERPSIHSATGDGLATVRILSGSTARLGNLASVSAGTEIEAARLGEGPTTLGSHPFATVTVEAEQTTVEYRVSSAPSMTGTGTLDGGASDDEPALVESNGRLAIEEGLHQELRLGRKLGAGWTAEVALFDDRLQHPVVQGFAAGNEAAIDSENVLYDPGTGIIAVSGHGYSHGGVMGLLRDQLSPDTWLSLRYALGDAESLAQPLTPSPGQSANRSTSPAASQATLSEVPSFEAHTASSVTAAAGTRIPITHTGVRGSYGWQPVGTLSQVAPFDSDREDAGAYLGFSLRQPIHLQHAGKDKLEAVLDIRNLLAQGYRPFLSKDGTMVYFAQSQRCFAAGFAFSF